MAKKHEWLVQVFGSAESGSWEISVVRSDNEHGHKSWGWFDDRKILISHDGGPGRWPYAKAVWNAQIRTAHEIRDMLNAGQDIGITSNAEYDEET